MLARIAAGALTLALSVAIPLSGIEGTVALVALWGVAGIAALYLLSTVPWVRQRLPRRKRRDPVLDDIQHREGCPQRPERMESYFQTRPDGIEVKVGRCADCGAAAYRHGDVPTAPPEPNPFSEPEPRARPELRVSADPLRLFDKRRLAGFGLACLPQLKIENVGGAPACDVDGAITEWKYRGRDALFRDHPNFGMPRPLGEREGTVEIKPGESARFDLAFALDQGDDDDPNILHLFIDKGGDRGGLRGLLENVHPSFPAGVYRAKVRITADDAEPVEDHFELDLEAWDRMRLYPVEPS